MLIPKPRFLGKCAWSYFFASSGIINDLDQVAYHYKMTPLYKVRPVHTSDNSKVNILIDQNHSKWVLKQYHDTMDCSAILFNHSILAYLDSLGFPSPRLRTTRTGQDCLSLHGHNFALFKFVPGSRYNDFFIIPRTKKQYWIQQAGSILARYHLMMADVNPSGQKREGYQAKSTLKRWDEYSWHRDEWNRLMPLATQLRNGIRLMTDEKAQHVSKMLYKLAEEEENREILPIIVIHGDFNPLNLLYGSDGSVQAVLDFDKVCFEERIEEVATSLLEFAGQAGGSIDLKDAHYFLSGYMQTNPLAAHEIKQLPYALQRNRLRLLVWMLRKYLQSGSHSAYVLFRSTLDRLDWLETNGITFLQNFLLQHYGM
jgi:Ser/Thr protein kinase RdoA (MazF antagonist)